MQNPEEYNYLALKQMALEAKEPEYGLTLAILALAEQSRESNQEHRAWRAGIVDQVIGPLVEELVKPLQPQPWEGNGEGGS